LAAKRNFWDMLISLYTFSPVWIPKQYKRVLRGTGAWPLRYTTYRWQGRQKLRICNNLPLSCYIRRLGFASGQPSNKWIP
jgi:hypothetical protein